MTLTIQQADLQELQEQQALIVQQRRILRALEIQLESYVTEHYEIDLTTDDWTLDLQEGTLRRNGE